MSSSASPLLIYLHGFNSSPGSYKAQMLLRYLERLGAASHYLIPSLDHEPQKAIADLQSLLDSKSDHTNITLLGSSLGGYYATHLAQQYPVRVVLINPAVNPAQTLERYLGVNQKFYSDDSYEFTRRHIEQLAALKVAKIVDPSRYLVLLQTGDETLDYREAEAFYAACDVRVEKGGSHGYSDFEHVIPEILAYAGLPSAETKAKTS